MGANKHKTALSVILKLRFRRTGNVALLNDLRCPRCSKLLGSKNALQRHKREVHSEEPSPSAAAAAAAAAAVGAGAGSGIVSAATERSNNNSRASSSNDGSWSGGGGGGGLSSPSSGYLHPQQPGEISWRNDSLTLIPAHELLLLRTSLHRRVGPGGLREVWSDVQE